MANSRMCVPTKKGVVKIPASDDSIPHIKQFLAKIGLPFNSREELHRFRCLKSSEQRDSFISDWKPQSDNVQSAETQISAGLSLATV